MKNFMKITLIFALFTVIVPTFFYFVTKDKRKDSFATEFIATETYFEDNSEISQEEFETLFEVATENTEDFKVLDITTGEVITLPMKNYIVGSVLAEMPATYHEEALKAQAVAAYTYAIRKKEQQILSPSEELIGAYISNDSTKFQAFFTEEQAKYFYGDSYDLYHEKVFEAVSDVFGEILVYENEPIIAAFHSTSSGKTENAENVWQSEVEYLKAVPSEYDESSPNFINIYNFKLDETKEILKNLSSNLIYPENPCEYFEVLETSDSETVTKILCCGKVFKGTEIRTAFNLKSSAFSVIYDEETEEFVFTTKGSGHFVGMSQYGANIMAENGKNYKEILLHYYSGASIIDSENS